MRQFAVQVLVNTAALILTILLMPGITLVSAQPLLNFFGITGSLRATLPWWLDIVLAAVLSLFLGIIYTLIDRYIKPLLLALTGRFIVWSMGLSILIINVVAFALFLWLTPVEWGIASPTALRILVGGILLAILGTILNFLTGVNQINLAKGDPDKGYWQFVERLPILRSSSLNEGVRVKQIYDRLFGFGQDILAARWGVARFRERIYEFMYGEPNPAAGQSLPVKTRILLEDLGPTWVKFGQMVASQAESLPLEWADELTRLQSSAEPFPSDQVVQIIQRELGAPPEELYATFDLKPLAAASTAQVHVATLHDGAKVAVKVERPDIISKTQADLRIIQDTARVVENRSKTAANLDLEGISRQFAKGVINELDYRNESYHTRRLADNMQGMAGIAVPKVYAELSSARVLTEEFVSGVKLTNTKALVESGLDRQVLATNFLAAVIKQILVDGFFHADPHPGNLFLNPQTGIITFLDLGLIGELSQQQRINLLDLLFTMTQNDPDELATVAANMSRKTRPYNERAYRQDMSTVFYQYWIYPRTNVSFNESMSAITTVLNNHGMRLDSSLTLAVKSMIQADQSLVALDPQIDLVPAVVEQAKTLMVAEVTPERIIEMVQTQVKRAGREFVRRMPEMEAATFSWLTQYQKGKFIVTVDTSDLTKGVDRFAVTVDRLTLGIILVGMLIGSAIAITSISTLVGDNANTFLPAILLAVFGVVLLFSVIVAIRMARSLNKPKDPYDDY